MTKLLSKDEVLDLVVLSALRLQDQEIPGVLHQLNDVLGYAARVGEIVQDVPETRSLRINVFREDSVGPSCGAAVLAGAPEVQEHYFVVPAVLESK